ncbi:hypothetical protein K2X05_00655 [bacterium]|nr:hypothetical protein [bacterium]
MTFKKINSGPHLSVLSFSLSDSESQVLLNFQKGAKVFFATSEEEKIKFIVSGGALNFRGYFKYKTQNYDIHGKKKDLKEGFDFGKHSMDRDFNHFYGANICPPQMRDFETVFNLLEEKSELFVRYLEDRLKIEKNQISHLFKPPIANLRVIHYPAQDSVNQEQVHLVQHHDPGFATFLFSDESATEYFCTEQSTWKLIPTIKNTISVVLGATAQRWSEGKIQAPLHRIEDLKRARTSLCFFYNPSFAAEVKSITNKDSFHAGRFIYCESVEESSQHDWIYTDIISNRIK